MASMGFAAAAACATVVTVAVPSAVAADSKPSKVRYREGSDHFLEQLCAARDRSQTFNAVSESFPFILPL